MNANMTAPRCLVTPIDADFRFSVTSRSRENGCNSVSSGTRHYPVLSKRRWRRVGVLRARRSAFWWWSVWLWQRSLLEKLPLAAHLGACQIPVTDLGKCGAVYDRSEHIEEAREISSFECAVCGKTIENWNSAWVPRYRFIACPAKKSE
jgi:hypothetical protein